MWLYIFVAISVMLNCLLVWYVAKLLKKFLYISQNLSDLFLTTKAFEIFVTDMYSMESYHGEPIIENLVLRTKEVKEEIEYFRDIFEYTLDKELEEELDEKNNAEEEIEEH